MPDFQKQMTGPCYFDVGVASFTSTHWHVVCGQPYSDEDDKEYSAECFKTFEKAINALEKALTCMDRVHTQFHLIKLAARMRYHRLRTLKE